MQTQIISNEANQQFKQAQSNLTIQIETHEQADVSIGVFDASELVGSVMVKSISNNIAKLRQLCVSNTITNSTEIANQLINDAIDYCSQNNYIQVTTSASNDNLNIFELNGFVNTNESFIKNDVTYFKCNKKI